MDWSLRFFISSIMLGIGLAMDAFSVSLANGLNEPKMKMKRMALVAGVFGVFQCVMPLIGWVCVRNLVNYFRVFEKFIPWIALVLLVFIGGNMLKEGFEGEEEEEGKSAVGLIGLMVQGIATSIDALSVGFTVASYTPVMAVVSCILIGAITFGICLVGLELGKKFGTKFAGKATILGGIILIAIGIEIFITGVFH